jgi:hypothetical protein
VITVRPSPIHGLGCFATTDIARDQLIGRMRVRLATRNGTYVIWDGEQPYRVLGALRYMNHSAAPNATVYDTWEVFALRAITQGEEVTFHYGDEFAKEVMSY